MLEDNLEDAELNKIELRKRKIDFVSKVVKNEKEFYKALKEFQPDLILSYYSVPQYNGLVALELAKKILPDIPFIMVTGSLNEEKAADCIRKGAWDYVMKERLIRLTPVIKNALKLKKEKEKKSFAEKALLESEERYRSIVENSHDGIITIDTEYKLIYCNDEIFKMFGYLEKEIIGQDFRKFLDKNSREMVAKRYREQQQEKKIPPRYEFDIIRKKGEKRNIAISSSVIRDSKGKLCTVAQLLDITDRKQAERKLQEREAFNFALFEFNPIETIIVDRKGKIIKSNLAVRENRNKIPKEGEIMYKDFASKHETEMYSILMNSIKTGKTINVPESKYEDKIWAITIAPFDKGAIISAKDITENKLAEQQIKKDLMAKEILLKEIHHRVKNNMQIISSILKLQSRSIRNEKMLKLFKESQNRIRSMALIHEKLYQTEDFTLINFNDYVRSLSTYLLITFCVNIDNVNLSINIKNVMLDIDIAIPCGLILNEVLSNSLKYAFPKNRKGNIWIEFSLNKGEYTMIIKDNGIGFSKNITLSNTETLGLQLVRALSDQLHGKVIFSGEKGMNFKITFKKKN